jgi:hypothetical protein
VPRAPAEQTLRHLDGPPTQHRQGENLIHRSARRGHLVGDAGQGEHRFERVVKSHGRKG